MVAVPNQDVPLDRHRLYEDLAESTRQKCRIDENMRACEEEDREHREKLARIARERIEKGGTPS